MSRRIVTLASTLVIHPTVPTPDICAVCAMWNDFRTSEPIIRTATHFAQWDDAIGPDNYIGICNDCRMGGFTYIGTIQQFKAAQLRAMGLSEYEIYGNDNAIEPRSCSSRVDACARIRKMIAHGISIGAIYQRSVNNGRLRKLNRDEQARIVIEAMRGND